MTLFDIDVDDDDDAPEGSDDANMATVAGFFKPGTKNLRIILSVF